MIDDIGKEITEAFDNAESISPGVSREEVDPQVEEGGISSADDGGAHDELAAAMANLPQKDSEPGESQYNELEQPPINTHGLNQSNTDVDARKFQMQHHAVEQDLYNRAQQLELYLASPEFRHLEVVNPGQAAVELQKAQVVRTLISEQYDELKGISRQKQQEQHAAGVNQIKNAVPGWSKDNNRAKKEMNQIAVHLASKGFTMQQIQQGVNTGQIKQMYDAWQYETGRATAQRRAKAKPLGHSRHAKAGAQTLELAEIGRQLRAL